MPPKAKPKASRRASSQGEPARRTSVGPAKARAKAKARATEVVDADSRELGPSPEFKAAVRLQAGARSWLARRVAQQQRSVRDAEQADAIQREAELAKVLEDAEISILKAERLAEEMALQREAEKKRKKEERERDIETLVSFAFDGEFEDLVPLLEKGVPVDARNRRGVTALSEAACGGLPDMVRFLLQKKGNPNSRCEFGRSPIWRASYRGHSPVVQLLLESGGDPRIPSELAELPQDIAASKDIEEMIEHWDVSRTDALVNQFDSWLEDQRLLDEKTQAQAMQTVEKELEKARQAYSLKQKALASARAGLRRKIRDHDTLLSEGKPESVLQRFRLACEEFEARVARAEVEVFEAQQRLDAANVKHLTAAEACGAEVKPVDQELGRAIQVRDLNDVLLRDVGNQIALGEKWFLMIDPSDCAPKFLQYSGNAVLNFWCADEMEPGHIRRALLSMIRGGGVLAINLVLLGAGTSFDLLAEPFEAVKPGLFGSLLTRQLVKPPEDISRGQPWFHALIEDENNYDMFSPTSFIEDRAAKFKFVVLTTSTLPHEDLLNHFDVLRVVPNTLVPTLH